MFRNAPTLCGRLFAVSAANAAKSGACPHAGAAAAANAAAARKTPSPTPPAAVCGFAASAAPPTIFDKLGGKAAMTAAVEKFYEKVLADPTVNIFFNGQAGIPPVSMAAQKRKQIQFLSFALGGPEGYKGKDMFEAHKHMDLKEEHFNAIATHLIATLKELGVKQQYIDEAIGVVATTKDAILKQGEYAGRK